MSTCIENWRNGFHSPTRVELLHSLKIFTDDSGDDDDDDDALRFQAKPRNCRVIDNSDDVMTIIFIIILYIYIYICFRYVDICIYIYI